MNEVITLNPHKNKRERSSNGTQSVAELLDSLYRGVGFTWLEEHEARHAVVAIVMDGGAHEASNVAEGNSGGHVTLMRNNLVAFAASHRMPGNSYDRAYVEAHGGNYDALGERADGIVARNMSLMRAIARAMMVERTLNQGRLAEIEDQDRNGAKVKIRVTTRDGREHVFEFRAREGEDITITVPLVEEEPVDAPKRGGETISANALPRFEEEPITESTFAFDLRKAA